VALAASHLTIYVSHFARLSYDCDALACSFRASVMPARDTYVCPDLRTVQV